MKPCKPRLDPDKLELVNAAVRAGVLVTIRPREQQVIKLRYGLDDGHPRTLQETSFLLNISTARIGQLLKRAFRRLNNPTRMQIIKEYLNLNQ
jgi:RNA polymerase primary sigma factor